MRFFFGTAVSTTTQGPFLDEGQMNVTEMKEGSRSSDVDPGKPEYSLLEDNRDNPHVSALWEQHLCVQESVLCIFRPASVGGTASHPGKTIKRHPL